MQIDLVIPTLLKKFPLTPNIFTLAYLLYRLLHKLQEFLDFAHMVGNWFFLGIESLSKTDTANQSVLMRDRRIFTIDRFLSGVSLLIRRPVGARNRTPVHTHSQLIAGMVFD